MIEDIDGRRWCPYGLKSAPTQILATVWWTRMFAIGEPELENQTLLRVPSWDPEEPQDNLGDFEGGWVFADWGILERPEDERGIYYLAWIHGLMLDLAVWRDWDREPLEFARVHTLNALGAGEAAAKWEAAFPHGTPPARIWVPADLDARLRRQWISVGPVFDLGVKDSPAYIKASAALDDVLAGSAEWQRWWDNADRPALELFAVYSDKISGNHGFSGDRNHKVRRTPKVVRAEFRFDPERCMGASDDQLAVNAREDLLTMLEAVRAHLKLPPLPELLG